MILTALAAGATSGALDEFKDEVRQRVKAACGKLRDLVTKRFREAGTPNAEAILAEYEADPEGYKGPLAGKLEAANAGADDDLVAAARAVAEILERSGRSGKYYVPVTNSRGVMVGDRNIQTNITS
jgi:hypothetical protein